MLAFSILEFQIFPVPYHCESLFFMFWTVPLCDFFFKSYSSVSLYKFVILFVPLLVTPFDMSYSLSFALGLMVWIINGRLNGHDIIRIIKYKKWQLHFSWGRFCCDFLLLFYDYFVSLFINWILEFVYILSIQTPNYIIFSYSLIKTINKSINLIKVNSKSFMKTKKNSDSDYKAEDEGTHSLIKALLLTVRTRKKASRKTKASFPKWTKSKSSNKPSTIFSPKESLSPKTTLSRLKSTKSWRRLKTRQSFHSTTRCFWQKSWKLSTGTQ